MWLQARDFAPPALSPQRALARRVPGLHTTIATFACGNIRYGITRWGIPYVSRCCERSVDSYELGTSNKPLSGAILCCTSIAPEQRVSA